MSIRQQAIATAQVYIRRFYLRVEIRRTNPYLVVSTALYLACKMEECPQHIRVIVSEARNIWPGNILHPPRRCRLNTCLVEFIITDVSKLGECEFFLISEMNCQLIVHHPYRTLGQLQNTLKMTQDEASLAWNIINDHYLTDLPLLYPLHVIAATSIFLALTLKPSPGGMQAGAGSVAALANAAQSSQETSSTGDDNASGQKNKINFLLKWLAESEIDIKAMIECTQEIISLYDIWEQYNDKTCKEQIARFVKARNLDK